MPKSRTGRPTKYSFRAKKALIGLVARGHTLEKAAREIGVHPATLYRWQNRYPDFEEELREAAMKRNRLKYMLSPRERPRVPWRKDCPECGYRVVVRTAGGMAGFPFWRCERWPRCRFASWRPPASWNCPRCGGTAFWSHSRKSVSCETYWCRYRQFFQSVGVR